MKIPIVDEQDNIIGKEERSIIHKEGLRHREVHAWLITPDKKIVFQKRALDKDTWPGYLDATAGGHVDLETETYEKAAERELLEETGIKAIPMFIGKYYSETFDPNTQTKNNKFLGLYAARFNGDITDLKLENNKALGFFAYSLDELKNLTDKEKKKFIPSLITDRWLERYEKMINDLFTHPV